MKTLVLCLCFVALVSAGPAPALEGDAAPPLSPPSSLSSESLKPVEKTSVDAAGFAGSKEPAAPPAAALAGAAADKGKAEKEDSAVEPVVEAAEPPAPSHDLASPVKKVPVFEVVPVEYAAAYHPDNFYQPYAPSTGFIGAPPRSIAGPWYHLVAPEVPILTLYPGDTEESYRGSGKSCVDPTVRYIHGAAPMIYTGPSAASPYAANQFAAASLAAQSGGNPNPYGTHVPYYKFPATAVPDYDDVRSALVSANPSGSPISIFSSPLSPLSR